MKKIGPLFLLIIILSGFTLNAQVRHEFLLQKGWKFTREDHPDSKLPEFDDHQWQQVSVPHDWAIYGPFSSRNDRQHVAITQDGQTAPTEHAGRTGGLPFVGVGWYRIKFNIPDHTPDKRVSLLFDGAMSNARVYINGQEVAYWPNGYNSFHVDISRFTHPGEEITLAVRLENLPESSRWYPGAGLYRNVHVIVTQEAYIPVWGTRVNTPVVKKELARIHLQSQIIKPATQKPEAYQLVTTIHDPAGMTVVTRTDKLTLYDDDTFKQDFIIPSPQCWDTENPALYTATSELFENGILKDIYTTRFGIRSLAWGNQGFLLNGKPVKFKGVCNHHDLGPLGAAVNDAAIRRQIRLLKDMGCNAIRTSHNMPAPELVNACDEMGMMLVAESFDEWQTAKCQNGYHLYFNEWVEKDLVNLIRHYRNNPSIIMWCIGNEVIEQASESGAKLTLRLQNICHREDPSRPVTQGMDNPTAVINNNFAAVMDIPGFNYRPFMYPENYRKLPQPLLLGTETASTVSSRGAYKFPVVRRSMHTYDDHQSSSYDVEHCGWSNLPEDDFIRHEDYPYCIGEFVWTGFDYLGEPTPYYTNWPSHSSLFGIIDLAGIPKDRYYLYRSHWNPDQETLHVLPHWTWPGKEGDTIPVFVYTNYPSAELFINGKSQGRVTKNSSVKAGNTENKEDRQAFTRQKRYRLMWMNTIYEPGTLRVVAYNSEGQAVTEKEVRTAGKPHHIELSADRTQLHADGQDLAFILVRIVDKDGNLCPDDDRQISFTVNGKGNFKAVANGNPASLESFQTPKMKLFHGQLTAIVQSREDEGEITFEARAPGVKRSTLILKTQKK